MNNIATFIQEHQKLEEGDFWQIDFCRHFFQKDYAEIMFSSFKQKKTEVISYPFSIFNFDMISDMLPSNINSALSFFAKKRLVPYSTENLILSFSGKEIFSFFHRKYRYHLQNNISFFEAQKNSIIPDKIQAQVQHCLVTDPIATGKYRIAFAPRAACFLVHELFGHIFENHKLLKSFLTRGFKCPSGFYFYDDPTPLHGYGSYEFDANFNKSQRCECIHNGKILTSMDFFKNTTIAQRVEDWSKKPEGRMSNIILNIEREQDDSPSFDLYVEDCFEGEEPSFESDILTLKTRSCFTAGGKLLKDTIVFSLNVFDFYHKYISSFSSPTQRAIDCFKPQSGWVRTSAEAPGIILDAIQTHWESAPRTFH